MLLLFGGDVFIELVMELGEVQLQPNSSKQLFYYSMILSLSVPPRNEELDESS